MSGVVPAVLCGALWAGAGVAVAQDAASPIAPELTGLGTLHVPVTASSPRAQRFFDQGMRLLYAFNHAEAIRAFREAARLDDGLAMAYWGQALALGPNLNAPMTPENGRLAHAAILQARERSAHVTERERALIEALTTRYAADGALDRTTLDRSYAEAMQRVADRFPGDDDIQTLYADALMNTTPWNYWMADGSPKPETTRLLDALERVIARSADHVGALHYHIHLLEASNDPGRAEPSADRLGSLMPAAGHMVHMPAHIYIRVGRYADAAEANERAIRADEDYLAQCQAQGLYPVSYYPHNLHFLWAAATLEGRRAAAVDAARRVAAKVPHHHAGALAWTADFPVTPLLAYVRFGLWQEVLTDPKPPAREPYATGIWHYARGLAFVARGQLPRADGELAALKTTMNHEAFATTLKDLPLLTNLQIALRVLDGELHLRRGHADTAVALVRGAVAIEDEIPYNEPPVWHQPPRQVLGAILLEAGRAAEAEAVYRDDLKRFPENGWSLLGLAQSLEAQHRAADAADARRRLARAWARADIRLTSSRILDADGAAAREPAPPATARHTPADVGPREQRVELRSGTSLSYVEGGDAGGTPVVLLHGYTDSWRSFEPVLPYLGPSLRVFAVTQRGHGDSAKPHHDYEPKHYARDVAELMDALGLDRAVVVGHSMGATVAQRFAIDYPERTRALVLVGAFLPRPGNQAIQELWDGVSRLADPIDPAFVREFQQSMFARPAAPGLVDMAVGESLKVPARVWQAALQPLLRVDFADELAAIRAPTLLIWGDRDEFAARHEQEALVSAIAGSRRAMVAETGPCPHWEEPATVAAQLTAFVSESAMGR